MKESFGNIKNSSLREAIASEGFKKYWKLTKDSVKICRICEYRYICTDCRAFIEEPNDEFSKPLKCGYNPYTCKWDDWTKDDKKIKLFLKYKNTIQ